MKSLEAGSILSVMLAPVAGIQQRRVRAAKTSLMRQTPHHWIPLRSIGMTVENKRSTTKTEIPA